MAYRKDEPNWLIFAARADRQARENMAEWEHVFGDGFMAVLASLANGEPTGIRVLRITAQCFGNEPFIRPHNKDGGRWSGRGGTRTGETAADINPYIYLERLMQSRSERT